MRDPGQIRAVSQAAAVDFARRFSSALALILVTACGFGTASTDGGVTVIGGGTLPEGTLPEGAMACTATSPPAEYASPDQVLAGRKYIGADGKEVEGTLTPSMLIDSQMLRDPGSSSLTQKQETELSSLPTGYRIVPDPNGDLDGIASADRLARPSVTCGITLATVNARIEDCALKNPTASQWDGSTAGFGQTKWNLVTRTASGKEVWRDEGTGLLWSDRQSSTHWCAASGVIVSGVCGGTSTVSHCAEIPSDTTNVNVDEKGQMSATASGTSPAVVWRLPTRGDFLIAETHGVREVLPGFSADDAAVALWSATAVRNDGGISAWTFSSTGAFSAKQKDLAGASAQCVGWEKK